MAEPRSLAVTWSHDDTVAASLRETSRLLVPRQAPAAGSRGASLIARMTCEHFELFDAPPVLVAADGAPVRYARELEEAWLPGVERIVAETRKLVAY